MPIRPLSQLLVNQIAAGEVIERPASVVKELIENAIDAGATRIDVRIENGGRDLIAVADDGGGIPFAELPLAIAPHATSKISRADDLNAIATMGFRGEALASIASVSRLALTSRPREQAEAGTIEVEGDRVEPVRPSGAPRGTSVVVRNLFFNTPARRKFLRTDRTEAARVAEVIEVLAIAHPAIGFTLRVDGQPRLDLPPAAAARERALQVLGGELEEQLLTLEESAHGLELWGLIGTPELARATGRHLKVFLNGRPISDRTISHAVREAFRGLIAPDRSPTAVLMVRIDPKHVDVNVHPAKAEVRFRDQSHVHGTVQRAVVRVLRGADLVPSLDALGSAEPKPFGSGLGGGGRGGSRELLEHFRGLDPASKGFIYQQVRDALRAESPELLEQGQGSTAATIDASAPLVAVTRAERVLQVHGCYLVAEDEQGLVIIDQHALHERVMFEQLKQRVSEGSLESQRLLLPATVEVEETQVAALASLKPLLERLGIDAEPIGPRTVAVHAFTSLLFERNVTPEPFLREILDSAEELSEQDDPEAALHRVLDMMACKAAIKAGDRLSGAEMEDLLRQRAQIDRSSRCPHGRPTTLRLTLADLDRQFGRSSRAGS